MRRLTESTAGIVLLVLTFVLAAAGLLTDLTDQSDPPTFYGAAVVAGIAAVAVALDEQRRLAGRARLVEAIFGRVLIVVALVLELVAVVLGLQGDNYRNLWLVLAIVVALDGLAVIVDSRRLFLARVGSLSTHPTADALLGAIAGALGLGLAGVGFVAGLVDNPHAPALLDGGVVLALLAVALMFDEQAHVAARIRTRRLPGSK
jgi:hypothetical protein